MNSTHYAALLALALLLAAATAKLTGAAIGRTLEHTSNSITVKTNSGEFNGKGRQ